MADISKMWKDLLVKTYGTEEKIQEALEFFNKENLLRTWQLDFELIEKMPGELSFVDYAELQEAGIDMKSWPNDKPFKVHARRGYEEYLNNIQDFIAASIKNEYDYDLTEEDRTQIKDWLFIFIPTAITHPAIYKAAADGMAAETGLC